MSSAYHGERGAVTTLRTTSKLRSTHGSSPLSQAKSSNDSQRHGNGQQQHIGSTTNSSVTSSSALEDSGNNSSSTDSPSNMQFLSPAAVAPNELLQDSVFPTWKDDAGPEILDSAEDMQKKDPLGTQIWKLYSKTKTRLPNQERMENLTWRMMAMNLKRREREQAALYDIPCQIRSR